MENLIKGLGAVGMGIGIIVLLGMVMTYPVMMLWNHCLVGAVDGVNVIGAWQTVGILILFQILFKSDLRSGK